MSKILLFAIVLCCGTWVVAQTNGSQSDSTGQTTKSTGHANSANSSGQVNSEGNGNAQSGSVKVTGCLKEQNGNFAIKDYQTGTSYSLYGNPDLATHVGQAVTVQGMPTGTSEEHGNSPTTGQNASANPFQVQSIEVHGECSQTNPK
jgi:hypothetical protein